jgi:hypothetical protein
MYVSKDLVFRQKEVLFPDYIPDHLPHREREIKAVSSIINSALKNRSQVAKSSSTGLLRQERQPRSDPYSESLKWRQMLSQSHKLLPCEHKDGGSLHGNLRVLL